MPGAGELLSYRSRKKAPRTPSTRIEFTLQESSANNPAKNVKQSRPALLLALGAVAGLAVAAWGLVGESATTGFPGDAIARVNDTVIREADFERLVAAVLQDMRTPDEAAARKRVLDRMIEEELLIQRALDLGLIHLDRKVRADLTASVITSVVSDIKASNPGEQELETFYNENKDYFTRPGRMMARQIFFRVTPKGKPVPEAGPGQSRAEKARARLVAGDAFASVKDELGDFEISPLPAAMLPAAKTREYLGPTLLRTLSELEVGAWSEPVRSGTGIHVAQVVEREPARTPPLAAIREQVVIDWRRRQGDIALRTYLDELRMRANVEIADSFE